MEIPVRGRFAAAVRLVRRAGCGISDSPASAGGGTAGSPRELWLADGAASLRQFRIEGGEIRG